MPSVSPSNEGAIIETTLDSLHRVLMEAGMGPEIEVESAYRILHTAAGGTWDDEQEEFRQGLSRRPVGQEADLAATLRSTIEQAHPDATPTEIDLAIHAAAMVVLQPFGD